MNNRLPPPAVSTSHPADREARLGVAYGLAAYGAWGLVPIYFKQVVHVDPLEVLVHRVIWSVALLALMLLLTGRFRDAVRAIAHKKTMLLLAGTTVLIAINWYLFIWAVGQNLVLQASLGYFINPLVNVLLGFVFLRERLRPLQTASVALAAGAVAYLTLSGGEFPWIALTLAMSFGFYGLLRKVARVGATAGLAAETTALLPAAIGYAVYLHMTGASVFANVSRYDDALLIAAGAVTTIPLLWFANAAKRLRLATLGFLQYIAPTGHFLLAVLVYRETFDLTRGISFVCIWTALGLYSFDTVRAQRRRP